MTDHPITPPPELVQQWIEETRSHDCIGAYPADLEQCVATRAAQWGADQELEACCEWLEDWVGNDSYAVPMRAARCQKPPNLKAQGFAALELLKQRTTDPSIIEPLTRALEALPE
jgi:hypothetical protein